MSLFAPRPSLAASGRSSLSISLLTTGTNAARTAAILALLRPVASEIVVALDDRGGDAADVLGAVADRVLLFTHREPGDRPVAWLFGACRGDWILNVDDDEVPSAGLIARLPCLVERDDLTHCWIARRWLHPNPETVLAAAPWSNEFQLRLVRADAATLRFTDEVHRPVVCEGPSAYVEEPLYHLDTAVSPLERRLAKALAYERARRGMRIGAYSHNTGLYVPELRPGTPVAPVPPEDRARIADVVAATCVQDGAPTATVERVDPGSIESAWPGAPFPPDQWAAEIELCAAPPRRLRAGVQETVDLRITNLGSGTYRRGQVTIGTRWDGSEGIRTSLPADVQPGETVVVPVHVLPPAPGTPVLELDLVHEHVRWFGAGARWTVEVVARRAVAVAGDGETLAEALDALALVPELEPTIVGAHGHGHATTPDPTAGLFGTAGTDTLRAVARAPRIVAAAARARSEFGSAVHGAEQVVVTGYTAADGKETRSRFGLLVLVLAVRAAGRRPLLVDTTPRASGRADRLLAGLVRRVARPVALDELATILRD